MHKRPFQNCIRYTVILFFLCGGLPSLFSQDLNEARNEKVLSEMQRLSRLYRSQGLQLQKLGNIEVALELYQKAVELDPSFASAHNDLGIVYEAAGEFARAEASYLSAIKAEPNYLSAYSNLALLYENKRDLDKAASYWQKRLNLGSPDDPWTKKARERLEDIRSVLSNRPLGDLKEQQVIDLVKDVEHKKNLTKKSNKELARLYFEKAKSSYQGNETLTAYKQALDALQMDPANTEITEFVEIIQTRLLAK